MSEIARVRCEVCGAEWDPRTRPLGTLGCPNGLDHPVVHGLKARVAELVRSLSESRAREEGLKGALTPVLEFFEVNLEDGGALASVRDTAWGTLARSAIAAGLRALASVPALTAIATPEIERELDRLIHAMRGGHGLDDSCPRCLAVRDLRTFARIGMLATTTAPALVPADATFAPRPEPVDEQDLRDFIKGEDWYGSPAAQPKEKS